MDVVKNLDTKDNTFHKNKPCNAIQQKFLDTYSLDLALVFHPRVVSLSVQLLDCIKKFNDTHSNSISVDSLFESSDFYRKVLNSNVSPRTILNCNTSTHGSFIFNLSSFDDNMQEELCEMTYSLNSHKGLDVSVRNVVGEKVVNTKEYHFDTLGHNITLNYHLSQNYSDTQR